MSIRRTKSEDQKYSLKPDKGPSSLVFSVVHHSDLINSNATNNNSLRTVNDILSDQKDAGIGFSLEVEKEANVFYNIIENIIKMKKYGKKLPKKNVENTTIQWFNAHDIVQDTLFSKIMFLLKKSDRENVDKEGPLILKSSFFKGWTPVYCVLKGEFLFILDQESDWTTREV
jgi:hypothetical protein